MPTNQMLSSDNSVGVLLIRLECLISGSPGDLWVTGQTVDHNDSLNGTIAWFGQGSLKTIETNGCMIKNRYKTLIAMATPVKNI